MKKKSSRKRPVSAVCSALGTALLILMILICIPLTVPPLLDYQPYAVISGSMEPAIPTGSLVYIKGMEAQDVQEGDVIAFYGGYDSSAIVTHRVVENRVVMGEFITKGDANAAEDMNPVEYENFIGRVEWSIPELGIIAQVLTSAQGKIAAACMIGLAVVLHLLAAVFDKGK